MRRHAKGSTQRQAGRLGRFFRGALATRGASLTSKGSGAPSARRFALPLSAPAAILAALALVAALASAAAPKVSTGSASNIEKTAARVNGTVNPEGALLEECKFEYGLTTSYGQTKACSATPAEIGTGTSNVAVKADLTGLTLGTTYHFRLVAKNPEGTVNGADETFKTLSPPGIAAEWAEGVTRNDATLKAQINPEGFATTYKLEWGTTTSYGNETSASNVGSDKTNHTVSNALSSLNPGITYHYRFVATNSIGTANGPDHVFKTYAPVSLNGSCSNQSFRIGPAAQLADCRAYEMVSPIDKNNGDIEWFDETFQLPASLNQSSLDGEKITYSSYKAFGGALSAPYTSQYLATRHAGEGWSTHNISPPARGGILGSVANVYREYQVFMPDLSSGWFNSETGLALAPGAIEGGYNLYKRNFGDGTYETVSVGNVTEYATFEGFTPDGSRTLFHSRDKLTPEAPAPSGGFGEKFSLYESVEGEIHLVSILPNGEPVVGQPSAGRGAAEGRTRFNTVDHTISDDGSRVFWTAAGARLYIRENPEREQSALSGGECTEPAKACTVLIAAGGHFWTASPDGSKMIYDEGGTLYEYDVSTKTSPPIAGEAVGVAGTSEDIAYVYFVSKENLDAGATAGGYNLYLRHEGAIDFIATLSDLDQGEAAGGVSLPQPTFHHARVTPDGRDMTFMSRQSLTGYDNTDAGSGAPVSEVYRYDADGEELSCISCNPSGARPSGSKNMPRGPFADWGLPVAAWIPPWENIVYGSRVLTDDGNRLFFNSFDALVPQDSNGAQDVYEWEAPGSGDCTESSAAFSAQDDGCITLLSSGESPQPSEFIDSSTSGNDAFIRTKSSLIPQDPGLIDIYDARVGGGFPAPSEPTPCVGDACQSAPEPSNDATPSSASFHGAGDPAPQRTHRGCRARNPHTGKGRRQAKSKHTKRCKRNNRRAGR